MSTPEQMLFATTHESSAVNLAILNGQLFASLHALARLNIETCRLVLSGAGLHWENVLRAQTPEQFACRQAATWPWLATQFAGYTHGWMDIASEATANFGRGASDSHDGHVRHLNTTLDGMARCARGVDAMLRAMNPLPVAKDGVPASQPRADSRDIAHAIPDGASKTSTAATQRSRSPGRRQKSS
ncbi:phasin family protein [Paraburkholderia sp. J7]|uniref:phasin family protein n=1 Tax=Paraburkholderia sp. J7 TaxID=2805438 RepID=UPI002AB670E5|nr:phasin family protein [Paraburkholderia sp. J7]